MEVTPGATLKKFLALVAVAGVMVGMLSTARPQAQPSDDAPISSELFARALDAPGTIVRDARGAKVVRVVVRDGGDRFVLYRVRVEGRFPPRPLRYKVFAAGEFIGYGTPTPDSRALLTVTADDTVTDAYTIDAQYESDSPGLYSSGPIARPKAEAPARSARGLRGPLDVTRAEYSLGDEVYQPTDIGAKIELTASVHYPTGLPGGPYPIALFLHGNHVTCYKGENKVRFEWPCRSGFTPIPNYAGYDYIAEPLASHGFIVVSVSANGVNALGNIVYDTGMRQRGELLEKHLDLWNEWSTTGGGPFGDTFVGKVDLTHIGTMGHSRGGEGVVWHHTVDEERATPYGIDAVLALAPVDFTRTTINDVTFATMLPTCDGDVSDLQGVHFFDDSRYSVPGDPTPKHTVTVFGANHNFFNKVWSPSSPYPGGSDDGQYVQCDDALAERPQRKIGKAYIVSFFRRYIQNDMSVDPIWTGAAPPSNIEPNRTLVSYLAPDLPTHRMDLFRYTSAEDLGVNHLGGDVEPRGLTRYGWCADTEFAPCHTDRYSYLEIHFPGLPQGVVGWSDHDAVLSTELPPGSRNVAGFDAFQFRATTPPGYQANNGVRYQDLVVALIDGAGNEAEVIASEVGNEALRQGVSERRGNPRGRIILNQVRFPLSEFDGVDLTDITTVEFRFSRMAGGVIHLADVAFSKGGMVIP